MEAQCCAFHVSHHDRTLQVLYNWIYYFLDTSNRLHTFLLKVDTSSVTTYSGIHFPKTPVHSLPIYLLLLTLCLFLKKNIKKETPFICFTLSKAASDCQTT